LSHFNQT